MGLAPGHPGEDRLTSLAAGLALTARQERQIVAAFKTQKALSGKSAQPHFLDDSVWQARRRKARTVPIIVAILLNLLVVILKTQIGP